MGIEELRIHDFPVAVTLASSALLVLAVGCAVFVALDLIRRPQPMTVMNFVWPLTMLLAACCGFRSTCDPDGLRNVANPHLGVGTVGR